MPGLSAGLRRVRCGVCHNTSTHSLLLHARRRRCGTRTCASSSCRSRGSLRRTSTWTRTPARRRSAAAPGWRRCAMVLCLLQDTGELSAAQTCGAQAVCVWHIFDVGTQTDQWVPCAQRHIPDGVRPAGMRTEQAVRASGLQSSAAHRTHGEVYIPDCKQQCQAWSAAAMSTDSLATDSFVLPALPPCARHILLPFRPVERCCRCATRPRRSAASPA